MKKSQVVFAGTLFALWSFNALAENRVVSISDSERVAIFDEAGEFTFEVPANISSKAKVLIVGGGGAGGGYLGGGGGGGQVLLKENVTLTAGGAFAVTVGAGGASAVRGGSNGAESKFSGVGIDFSALGGGAGGGGYTAVNGNNGASGGGAGGGGGSATGGQPVNATTGSTGGSSVKAESGYHLACGGGGGAGGSGADGSLPNGTNKGGDGGLPLLIDITGTSVGYGAGGGGAVMYPGYTVGAQGGAQDGYGNAYYKNGAATQGKDGTGGGGGGGGDGTLPGANGGSGCVIIRYTVGEVIEPPVIASATVSAVTTNSVSLAVEGSSLNGGEITVSVLKDETVAEARKFVNWGSCVVSGLEVATEYQAEIVAANIGGYSCVTCQFTTANYPWAGAANASYKLGKSEWVHIYREPGTYAFTAPRMKDRRAQVLVVGAGGGGGGNWGGGGGGGGVITNEVTLVPNAVYEIVVGGGGTTSTGAGGKGNDSSLKSADLTVNVEAEGGGAGAGGWNGGQGGSGANGGGGAKDGVGGSSSREAGYAGGTGYSGSNQGAGGGGGGAGGPGENGGTRGSSIGGTGGPGITNSISGVAVVYGYGGGGAGMWFTAKANSYGLGGAMNGYGDSYGLGQYEVPSFDARPGEPGTGGGGGAGVANNGSFAGACGGSGCVIIRYTEPPPGLCVVIR